VGGAVLLLAVPAVLHVDRRAHGLRHHLAPRLIPTLERLLFLEANQAEEAKKAKFLGDQEGQEAEAGESGNTDKSGNPNHASPPANETLRPGVADRGRVGFFCGAPCSGVGVRDGAELRLHRPLHLLPPAPLTTTNSLVGLLAMIFEELLLDPALLVVLGLALVPGLDPALLILDSVALVLIGLLALFSVLGGALFFNVLAALFLLPLATLLGVLFGTRRAVLCTALLLVLRTALAVVLCTALLALFINTYLFVFRRAVRLLMILPDYLAILILCEGLELLEALLDDLVHREVVGQVLELLCFSLNYFLKPLCSFLDIILNVVCERNSQDDGHDAD